MKVLVTGGGGFIGRAIAGPLVEEGFDVRVFDLMPTSTGGAEGFVGSILEPDDLAQAVRGCDCVIHLAAMVGVRRTEIKRLECLRINIQGTVNVLDACVEEGVEKVVFSSSSEVYGEPPENPISEATPVNPLSTYGISKLAAEEYVKAYDETHDIDYTLLRLFNVYGPGQVAEFVIPRFVKAVLEGRAPVVYGDGEQVRTFCFVDDVTSGIRLALESEAARGQIVNLGNDQEPISIISLARRVIGLCDTGEPINVEVVPYEKSDRRASREIRERIPDISKARKLLRYEPQVSLDQGILRLVEAGEIEETFFEPL
ncbi:MAG: NAD-dependent epimerase/dehydratase family protein [Dehalococcoidia bacterium]